MPFQFNHPPLPQAPTASGCGGETCDPKSLVHALSYPAKMRGDMSSWTPQTGAEKVHVQSCGSPKRFNVIVDKAFLSEACQETFAIWPLLSPLLPAEMRTECKGPQQNKKGADERSQEAKYAGKLPEWLALTASLKCFTKSDYPSVKKKQIEWRTHSRSRLGLAKVMQKAEKEKSLNSPIILLQPRQCQLLPWALISISHNDKPGGAA